jgi:hypothetical protein
LQGLSSSIDSLKEEFEDSERPEDLEYPLEDSMIENRLMIHD